MFISDFFLQKIIHVEKGLQKRLTNENSASPNLHLYFFQFTNLHWEPIRFNFC